MNANVPFEYTFLDKNIEALYEGEQRMSSIISLFAVLAIFISCLGLFGLVTFMAQRKVKEIGIRKVLGASVFGIVSLLSKEFVRLIIVAFILAIPISYYFLNQWLNDFAYRIQIHWSVFLFAGLGMIVVALLTVSVQSIKAALANPVESLRSE